MKVTRGVEWGYPKCLEMRTGGEAYYPSCVRTHLYYLFSGFVLWYLVLFAEI